MEHIFTKYVTCNIWYNVSIIFLLFVLGIFIRKYSGFLLQKDINKEGRDCVEWNFYFIVDSLFKQAVIVWYRAKFSLCKLSHFCSNLCRFWKMAGSIRNICSKLLHPRHFSKLPPKQHVFEFTNPCVHQPIILSSRLLNTTAQAPAKKKNKKHFGSKSKDQKLQNEVSKFICSASF